jgi:hypothetical protein
LFTVALSASPGLLLDRAEDQRSEVRPGCQVDPPLFTADIRHVQVCLDQGGSMPDGLEEMLSGLVPQALLPEKKLEIGVDLREVRPAGKSESP